MIRCKLVVGFLSDNNLRPEDIPMETDSQDGPKQKVLSHSYSKLNICCLIQNLEIIEFSDF